MRHIIFTTKILTNTSSSSNTKWYITDRVKWKNWHISKCLISKGPWKISIHEPNRHILVCFSTLERSGDVIHAPVSITVSFFKRSRSILQIFLVFLTISSTLAYHEPKDPDVSRIWVIFLLPNLMSHTTFLLGKNVYLIDFFNQHVLEKNMVWFCIIC